MIRRWQRGAVYVLLGTALDTACVGNLGDSNPETRLGPGPSKSASESAPESASASADSHSHGSVPSEFATPTSSIFLLPFSVRLSRVAAVAGVSVTNPVLESLRERRTLLGDHDFANSIKPDNTWTALKISEWVKAVRPVCRSPAMRTRFPALPDRLGALIEAAYGRAATPADTAAVTMSLSGLSLDDTSRYEIICLSVFSSLEFLAQ